MYTIRTNREHVTARLEYTHVDFSQPSAIDMEAQVNVNHQLWALLPDLVNKRTNTHTHTHATNRVRLFIAST